MRVFVIVSTFPSGNKYCFSRHEDTFALVPFTGLTVNGALAWESHDEAEGYLIAQLLAAPDLRKMGPFKIEAMEKP